MSDIAKAPCRPRSDGSTGGQALRQRPNAPNCVSKKRTSRWLVGPAAAAVALLAGCRGIQSALEPHGPQAKAIAELGWVMFWGATAILVLVMALALYAFRRDPERRAPSANAWIAVGGVAFPVVVLSALLIYGVVAMGNLRATPADVAAQIEIHAHRWWWEVHYRDANGGTIVTANEIRIPAGKPVLLSLHSKDVIHSFWVPNLAGKIDLVPGRTNRIVLQADRPGVHRGQCAEFCGAQHARMAFHVIAEQPQQFAAWLDRLRMPARAPVDAIALRGRDAFNRACASCHLVRGTGTGIDATSDNAAIRGPDLTHVASRSWIAAGTLTNNRDNLLAYIANSQTIKPGSGMPSHAHLGDATLQAIARYLETLD